MIQQHVTKASAALLALCLCILPAVSCTDASDDTDVTAGAVTETTTNASAGLSEETESDTAIETETEAVPVPELEIAKSGVRRSNFRLVYDLKSDVPLTAEAEMFRAMLLSYTGADIRAQDSATSGSREIVLASQKRPETAEMLAELREGEFAIRTTGAADGSTGKVFLAATTYRSFVACAEYLFDNYYTREKGLYIPTNVDVKGHEKEYAMITTNIKMQGSRSFSIFVVIIAYSFSWPFTSTFVGM